MAQTEPSFVALSGGVGGAKLALGLQAFLPPGELDIIANTGDDFEHLGLTICPDIDTLLYTLSGRANPARGWGMRDETWQFMASLEALGGETWFQLGDRDLATHVRRTTLLEAGMALSAVTRQLATALQVPTRVHPMSDEPVRTILQTDAGQLAFQEYFVQRRAEPVVTDLSYTGSKSAAAGPGALAALTSPRLRAILLTPSNPWLSIAPILSLPALKSTILTSKVPVVGVSPIVAGKALKGPAAKLMGELGLEPGVLGIARHYAGVLDGLVIDQQDREHAAAVEAMGITTAVTDTIMTTLEDKTALASFVIDFAGSCRKGRREGHRA